MIAEQWTGLRLTDTQTKSQFLSCRQTTRNVLPICDVTIRENSRCDVIFSEISLREKTHEQDIRLRIVIFDKQGAAIIAKFLQKKSKAEGFKFRRQPILFIWPRSQQTSFERHLLSVRFISALKIIIAVKSCLFSKHYECI